jgi:hypothetical protein
VPEAERKLLFQIVLRNNIALATDMFMASIHLDVGDMRFQTEAVMSKVACGIPRSRR